MRKTPSRAARNRGDRKKVRRRDSPRSDRYSCLSVDATLRRYGHRIQMPAHASTGAVASVGQFLERHWYFFFASASHKITWRVVSRNCDRSLPVMSWNWDEMARLFPFALLAERERTGDAWEARGAAVVGEHGIVEAMAAPVSPHGFRRTRRRPQSALPNPAGGSTPHPPLRVRITACWITDLSDRSRRCAGSCEVLVSSRIPAATAPGIADATAQTKCWERRLREAGTRQVTELTTPPTGPLGARGSRNPHRRRQPPPMGGGRP
jgi:hypothetical protein